MQWVLAVLAASVAVGVQAADQWRGWEQGPVPAWPLWLLGSAPGVASCVVAVIRPWAASASVAAVRTVDKRAVVVWRFWGPWFWFGVCLGAGAHVSAPDADAHVPGAWRVGEAEVTLVGVVAEGARPRRDGGAAVLVEGLWCDGRSCSGRWWVTTPPGVEGWVHGDMVRARGEVWTPGAREAAYLFDGRRWAARRGLAGGVSVRRAESARLLRRSRRWRGALDRARLGREAWVRGVLGDVRAAPLLALLTGSRGLVSPQQREAIDEAGLSHLLAISGLHLMALGGALRWGVKWLLGAGVAGHVCERRAGRAASLLAWVGVGLYATLTGWPLSARRAFVMLSCWLGAEALDRRAALGPSVSLAALVLWLGDTTHAFFDVGLQLSLCAVVSMGVAWRPSVGEAGEGVDEVSPGAVWCRRAWSWVKAAMGATLASSAGCAPLLMAHFGRLPLLGLLLNLVAVPLVQFGALGLGASSIVCSWVSPSWSALALRAAARSLSAVAWLAERCPWAGAGAGLVWPECLVLGLVLAGALLWRGRPRVALCVVFVASMSAAWWPSPGVPELRFLPVGQGDAILIRDGAGASMLVDAGGSARGGVDPGRGVVVPAMARHGVQRLDVVVISHADADHIAGMASVVREGRPREVWWWLPEASSASAARVLEAASEVGAVVRAPPSRWCVGRICGRRLSSVSGLDEGLSRNERSLVLEVEVGGLRALLTGDIESLGEWRTLPHVRRVHVLKVAHHGSETSSSAGWLSQARPSVAVVQVGRGNRFGHPSAQALRRLEAVGARVYSGAARGEVVVRVDGGMWSVWTHRR